SKTNTEYKIPIEEAKLSTTWKHLIKFTQPVSYQSIEIPHDNISDEVLKKVTHFCHHYHNHTMKNNMYLFMNKEFLFELISAANFLDISPLFTLLCQTISE